MTDSRCDAHTGRLNCGCCDDVQIGCDLLSGHNGPHHSMESARSLLTNTWETYEVHWMVKQV